MTEQIDAKIKKVSKEYLVREGFQQHSKDKGLMYKTEYDGESLVYIKETDGLYKRLKH